MLPGFRFVFAAIALSISILVFSLGAAALLRAAHQEFAGMPRLIAAEPVFPERNEAGPALAMLRADPTEAGVSDDATAHAAQIAVVSAEPSDPASSQGVSALPEAEKIAVRDDPPTALEDVQPSTAPEALSPEPAMPAETRMETPAPVERDVAAVEETLPLASAQPALTAPVPPVALTEESTGIAMTRTATLAGPAMNIRSRPKIEQRRTPKKRAAAAVKKTAPKQRVVTRPKVAPRPQIARSVRQQPAAPSAAPFGSWDDHWPGSAPAGQSAFRF